MEAGNGSVPPNNGDGNGKPRKIAKITRKPSSRNARKSSAKKSAGDSDDNAGNSLQGANGGAGSSVAAPAKNANGHGKSAGKAKARKASVASTGGQKRRRSTKDHVDQIVESMQTSDLATFLDKLRLKKQEITDKETELRQLKQSESYLQLMVDAMRASKSPQAATSTTTAGQQTLASPAIAAVGPIALPGYNGYQAPAFTFGSAAPQQATAGNQTTAPAPSNQTGHQDDTQGVQAVGGSTISGNLDDQNGNSNEHDSEDDEDMDSDL